MVEGEVRLLQGWKPECSRGLVSVERLKPSVNHHNIYTRRKVGRMYGDVVAQLVERRP